MKNNRYFLIAIVFLLSMQLACVKKPDILPQTAVDDRPLLTVLKNNYNFSMIYSALKRTGLDKTLEGKGPFTLLAPDNDAFSLSGISVDSLAKIDTGTLRKLISYHIIPASVSYTSIPQVIDFTYKTLAGPSVYFSVPLATSEQQQSLTSKIVHINGVSVSKTDITASNGYIMELSKVLYYPATSIKAYLENSPQYSYFTQALKQFGLLDQLDKSGPFVVMAPNNDAFANFGIDKTALAAMDTLTYKKFLFSPYVLSPNLFFTTDFMDAPIPHTAPPGFITPNFIEIPSQVGYGLKSLDYKIIEIYDYYPPYGDSYIYGPPVQYVDPNHQALNGVVHGINGLVMTPDSAKIQH